MSDTEKAKYREPKQATEAEQVSVGDTTTPTEEQLARWEEEFIKAEEEKKKKEKEEKKPVG